MRRPYKCRVQYLESTGTQWIDTGVSPATATDIEIKIQFRMSPNYYWFGVRPSSSVSVNNISGRGQALDFCNGSSYDRYRVTLLSPSTDIQYLCRISRAIRSWSANGQVITQSTAQNTDEFTTDLTYYLFRVNGQDGVTLIRCYGLKIRLDNGTLIRDLIPVLDNSGVPCMYDRVSQQLFYNQGTGQFLYGAEIGMVDSCIPYRMNPMGVAGLPYKRKLQYLESTGTQYLLINKTITQDSNIEVKFQGVNTVASETPVVYGCNPTTRPYLWAGKGSGGNWNVFVAMGNSAQILKTITGESYNGEQHVIGNSGLVGYFDDTTYTFSATFSYNRICFFGSDSPNGPDYYPTLLAKIRIYYIKCDGLDLIPVLDHSGVPCMYDKGTNQFFYNSGSGQFNYA